MPIVTTTMAAVRGVRVVSFSRVLMPRMGRMDIVSGVMHRVRVSVVFLRVVVHVESFPIKP